MYPNVGMGGGKLNDSGWIITNPRPGINVSGEDRKSQCDRVIAESTNGCLFKRIRWFSSLSKGSGSSARERPGTGQDKRVLCVWYGDEYWEWLDRRGKGWIVKDIE